MGAGGEPVAGKKRCKCGEMADPVHRAAGANAPEFRGWFCAHCGQFINRIGRERGLRMEVKE